MRRDRQPEGWGHWGEDYFPDSIDHFQAEVCQMSGVSVSDASWADHFDADEDRFQALFLLSVTSAQQELAVHDVELPIGEEITDMYPKKIKVATKLGVKALGLAEYIDHVPLARMMSSARFSRTKRAE